MSKIEISEREYLEAVLTTNTLLFTQYFYKKRFKRRYIAAKHHVQIAEALDAVYEGKIKRLMINIFPRSGKTEIAIKNFVAKGLAINPASKFIHLTYSQDLALDNSEAIRDDFICNEEYQRIFPFVQIDKSSTAKNKWYTTVGGGLYAAAAGGAITGFGAGEIDDITDEELWQSNSTLDKELGDFLDGFTYSTTFNGAILIDDPIKPDDAFSETKREKTNRRWLNTIKSRANSINTPIIIIGQRLHPDDFCGYVLGLEGEEWTVINIPALSVNEEGEYVSVWESKMPVRELLKIKENDEYTFQSQYQQDPVEAKGLLFPKSELKFISTSMYNLEHGEYKLIQIDPADQGTDDFAGGLFIVYGDRIVLHDVIYTKDTTEITEPLCVEQTRECEPETINVEGNGGWAQFGKSLRSKASEVSPETQLRIYPAVVNKNTRILAQSAFIKNHFYFRDDYEKIPMYAAFMKNLTTYLKQGTNKHDDAPDMCAGAAKFFRSNLDVFRS